MRGIGGSIGIAVVSWLLVRQSQIHFNELTAHITPFNRDLVPYLAERGLGPLSPEAAPAVVQEITRQAYMLAFNDIFWFIAVVTLAIIPLVFLMKRPEKCRWYRRGVKSTSRAWRPRCRQKARPRPTSIRCGISQSRCPAFGRDYR